MLQGALIGIGKIAQTGHLPAYERTRVHNRACVVAAADPSEANRERAAERYPGLRLYTGAEEMLAQEDLDFVDICTPPSAHAKSIELAVDRNLHILCEKPFAKTIEEALVLIVLLRKAERSGKVFLPCHQYKHASLWQHFKLYVDTLQPETKFFAQFNVNRTAADPGYTTENEIWRTNKVESGGGILADTGVHYLYLALWMMGFPHSISTRVYNLAHPDSQVEDTAIVILEFEKGIAEINLTWSAHSRANSASIVSKEGSLRYNGSTLVQENSTGTTVHDVPDFSDKQQYIALYVSLIDAFVRAIQQPHEQWESIREAYQSIELLHACYSSARNGAIITKERNA